MGSGWDVHRLVPAGKPFVLAGVRIDYPLGLKAHSDGDVVAHSLADALLSAIGENDIGEHFPDNDPNWENATGEEIVGKVVELVRARGFTVVNVVITIFAQYPKLKPYRISIKNSVCKWLNLETNSVAVHFNTVEGLGVIGAGAAVACHTVVLIKRKI